MKLRDLEPGTHFRYPVCGKTATLLSVGPAGARIRYDDNVRQVEFQPGGRSEVVAFETPGRPVLVSDYSDVEVIAQG